MYRYNVITGILGALLCDETVGAAAGTPVVPTPISEADKAAADAAEAVRVAEMKKKIVAQFNNLVDVKDYKFHFKKIKDEKTGLESKRPTVELSLPVLSVEGVIDIIEHGVERPKELELLMEAVAEVIQDRARELVNSKEDISQENFPLESLSWAAIANLPRAERRGGGISKEVWEEFAKDYIEVMPAVTGKTAEQIGNASKILLNKFNQVKTNKPVLKLLKEQLGLYAQNSPNAETYEEAIKFLVEKADTLLNMDEASLLANL